VPCCGHSGASPAISGIGWRYATIRLKASTRRQQSRRSERRLCLVPHTYRFLGQQSLGCRTGREDDAVRGCFTFVPTSIHCGGDASPSNAELSARPTARLRKRRPRRHDVEASVVRLSRLTIRGQSAVGVRRVISDQHSTWRKWHPASLGSSEFSEFSTTSQCSVDDTKQIRAAGTAQSKGPD
jgi:hypothetical protein